MVPLLGEFYGGVSRISARTGIFDNRQVDLIGQGFDAAIGGGFELPQGVVARKLTPAHSGAGGFTGLPGATPTGARARRPVAVQRSPDPLTANRACAFLAVDQCRT